MDKFRTARDIDRYLAKQAVRKTCADICASLGRDVPQPIAAPNDFPYRDHRTVADVDQEENGK
jgi:hypothetical protein